MKISIFGTGYVGLVTGVCFAEMGNDVICADVDQQKIAKLNQGISPIYEPGLDELIQNSKKDGRLSFTTDLTQAVLFSDLLFIAVGTPPSEDGSADLKHVLGVAKTIGEHMAAPKIVINKSTVPVGTGVKVRETIEAALRKRGADLSFDVVSNPEFLKEGTAIDDCLKPSRVVIGLESDRAKEAMSNLYEPFLKNGNPIFFMSLSSAEMTKYAANAMLAAKITVMNEFSVICEKVGADIEEVRQGLGSDPRIGNHFIYAGLGYGGSCFPKDVKALIKIAKTAGVEPHVLESVERVNQEQRERYLGKIKSVMGSPLDGRKIAVWGLAFKPGTDDVREAPALFLIENLLQLGAEVSAYDPVAVPNARAALQENGRLSFHDNQYLALQGADALCVVTEWKSFREPDFARIKSLMKSPVVFDGRNIFSPKGMRSRGFRYFSIGRGDV